MLGQMEEVLDRLNHAGVRYLVVGGVAVVLHGHLRTTLDLDLVLELKYGNLIRGLRALAGLGYRPHAPVTIEEFADPEVREKWIAEKGLQVFSLWSTRFPMLRVDLFVREPFDFDAAWGRAFRAPLRGTVVPIASRQDLIAMKRSMGRPQDLTDILALEALGGADTDPDPSAGRVGEEAPDGWDIGYEGHWRRQVRWGLRLAPAERLRWLEESVDWARSVAGSARPPAQER